MIRPAKDPEQMLRDGEALKRALIAAQREAVLRHRRLGIPVAVWRDGKVFEVPAESIKLPDDPGRQT